MMEWNDTGIPRSHFAEPLMSETEISDDADFSVLYDLTVKEQEKILREEGPYHVNGRYFADESDAYMQRSWLAHQRVREALRRKA